MGDPGVHATEQRSLLTPQ